MNFLEYIKILKQEIMNINDYLNRIQTKIDKVKCVITMDKPTFLKLESEFKSSRWFKRVKILKLEKYGVNNLMKMYQLNVDEGFYPFTEEALLFLSSKSEGNPTKFKHLLLKDIRKYHDEKEKWLRKKPQLIG